MKLRAELVERAAAAAKAAGYSTTEELIEHALEQWLQKIALASAKPGSTKDGDVAQKLRGLGYM